MSRFENSATRVFAVERDVVWAVVSDSNRMNRAVGNVPGRYSWREIDGQRRYVAIAAELGQALEWYEPPYQWAEGEFIDTERIFVRGPLDRAFMKVRLRDVEGGTECRITMGFSGQSAALSALGWIISLRHKRALRRALDAVGDALKAGEALVGDDSEPAVVRARRMLTQGYNPTTSGERTAVDTTTLATRVERLAQQPVDRALVQKLGAWLTERPDEEVAQLAPFELARVWKAERRDVLRLFLHATRVGLVDLRWQVNCPVCRVSAQVTDSLEGVGREVHCAACNLPYGVDFGRYVEAIFQSNAQVRRVTPSVFCAASPAWRPHVFAQLTVAPGGNHTLEVDLPLGELHLRALEQLTPGDITSKHAPRTLTVEIDDQAVRVRADGQSESGRTTLIVTSTASAPHTVLIERSGWQADRVLGSVVATFPDFLDLFATEAPATGVELIVGHLTVLFSDLTGSTAMYQRIGDAKAFALVEAHFSLMGQAVAKFDGAVIKTMGDAVMATFTSPEDAVRAAKEMARAHDADLTATGLGLKLGLHSGACLAVRANDRLDFFGTTVNLAARLQAQAHAGELVITEELAADPRVAALIDGRARRSFDASLKGIDARQHLVGVDLH